MRKLGILSSDVPKDAEFVEIEAPYVVPRSQREKLEALKNSLPDGQRAHAGRGHPKIDTGKMLRLRYQKKLSVKEIAQYFGCNPSAVSMKLKAYVQNLPNSQELGRLDSIRGDMVKATFFTNLSHLSDPAKLKKASLNNVAYSASQLHNMLRLEEGKSTANIFSAEYFAFVKQRGQEESAIEAKVEE